MSKKTKRKSPDSTPFMRFLFVVYAGLLLWLLFDRPITQDPVSDYAQILRGNMNLIPFQTIGNYWKVVTRWQMFI